MQSSRSGRQSGESMEIKKESPNRVMDLAKGEGNRVLLFNEDGLSVWEDEKVLEMDGGDGCITL